MMFCMSEVSHGYHISMHWHRKGNFTRHTKHYEHEPIHWSSPEVMTPWRLYKSVYYYYYYYYMITNKYDN